VFPAVKKPKLKPSRRTSTTNKAEITQPPYPCGDWRDTKPPFYCAACDAEWANEAARGVGLQNIVDRVVRAYGAEISGPTQEKLFNYIRLLASTGIPDEKLLIFGRAYLREILKPNPRYTGC
jgi:hypothetical protein